MSMPLLLKFFALLPTFFLPFFRGDCFTLFLALRRLQSVDVYCTSRAKKSKREKTFLNCILIFNTLL